MGGEVSYALRERERVRRKRQGGRRRERECGTVEPRERRDGRTAGRKEVRAVQREGESGGKEREREVAENERVIRLIFQHREILPLNH